MACFMIGCRLSGPGNDYIALAEAIERLGRTWECPGSTWVVATDKTAADIRDELRPYLDTNDELLVAELSGDVAWRGTSKHFSEGLRAVFG
jgi:hypothetical protein